MDEKESPESPVDQSAHLCAVRKPICQKRSVYHFKAGRQLKPVSMVHDPVAKTQIHATVPSPKTAKQRAGRAGRTTPGINAKLITQQEDSR